MMLGKVFLGLACIAQAYGGDFPDYLDHLGDASHGDTGRETEMIYSLKQDEPFICEKTFYGFSSHTLWSHQTKDWLIEAHKLGQEVSLTIDGYELDAINFVLPYMEPVRSLTLKYGLFRDSLSLSPSDYSPDDLVMQALAQATTLTKLKHFKAQWGSVSSHGLAFIITSPTFHSLVELEFLSQDVANEGVKILAEKGSNFSQLKTLSLERCKINIEGLGPLMMSSLVTRLEKLNLSHNYLFNWGMQCVVNGAASNLVELHLAETFVEDDEVIALAKKDTFATLEVLNLKGTFITSKSVVALVQSPHLTRIRSYNFSLCRVGDKGANALVEATNLHLVALDLRENRFLSRQAQASLKDKFSFVQLGAL